MQNHTKPHKTLTKPYNTIQNYAKQNKHKQNQTKPNNTKPHQTHKKKHKKQKETKNKNATKCSTTYKNQRKQTNNT